MDSAAVRGGATPPMPSSQSGPRKEWQTVPDNSLRQSNTDDQLERGKIGQSDERTIYEVNNGKHCFLFFSILG
ncbi:hypothetical protein QJS04_geneDACA006636 [Acorus gramineus]|uniref:Uncharacterized protein n=1 Tax=Acorus gramineus TaxID=55184 RepID=A0AAV9A2P1_ACOGR|nr:hypothetical protein QJS04_geneDACA006636 [Acorus gramineus]